MKSAVAADGPDSRERHRRSLVTKRSVLRHHISKLSFELVISITFAPESTDVKIAREPSLIACSCQFSRHDLIDASASSKVSFEPEQTRCRSPSSATSRISHFANFPIENLSGHLKTGHGEWPKTGVVCVSIAILLVELCCGGPWITERDVAGLLLPGLLMVLGFVIGLLRGFRFWFASCVGRT
jgi:hypothetical protein